jgi:hypothetical protein
MDSALATASGTEPGWGRAAAGAGRIGLQVLSSRGVMALDFGRVRNLSKLEGIAER